MYVVVFMAALSAYANAAMADIPKAAAGSPPISEADWTVDLPPCKRDVPMWKAFSPWGYLRQEGESEATVARLTSRWRKEDAVDVTWVDIDGDGWCDAITSGQEEVYKQGGKPILLYSPRGIYMRTANGFKAFKVGMIPSDYEGSSFTIYWDNVSKSAVIYKRIWQGNLVGGGGGDGGDEFHVRHMLRAMFAAQKANKDREAFDYFTEVDPFFYTRQMPRDVARRIWNEEAERAGVDEAFPYLN
jgi:hypothetical protein